MDELITDVMIINRALSRIGAGEISALDEETSKARTCNFVYRDRVDSLLAMHRWSFARRTYRLDLIGTINDGIDTLGWAYAYQIPILALSKPHIVMTNPRHETPIREFKTEADVIYCDQSPVWARFTVRVDPNVWPPLFREGVVLALASELSVPISHDTKLADYLKEQAFGAKIEAGRGGLIGKAMAMDLSGEPVSAPLYTNDPLTMARESSW